MSVSVVGFDIGSLTSFIGVGKSGGIEVITNEYSERNNPTCVGFSGDLRLIGTAAKLQHVMNIQNTLVNFTQFVGKSSSDVAVKKEMKYLTNKIEEGSDGRIYFPVNINGEKFIFTPEQMLAMQMTKLKEVVESALKSKVVDVVMNVPTYYTDAERRSVLDASRIAGLNCVKLVNDLTAVATAYGFYKYDLPPPDKPPKHVVFVIVGYTSTQVSICAFNAGKMKVLSTSCDPFLGGRDFDYKLMEPFANRFQSKYKLNVYSSPKAIIRLLQECEKLKKSMSSNSSELPINVECLMEERDLNDSMKRSHFEELCSDLITKFKGVLERALSTANLTPESIQSVELIGGSSRIPVLKSTILQVFKQEGCTSLNADEAVARGCTFQAAICSPAFKVKDFAVTEACMYPIALYMDNESGVENGTSDINGSITIQDKVACIEVFPLNHAIPSSRQIVLSRRNPLVVEARYTNVNMLPNQNVLLGKYKIGNVSQNEPQKIRLKLRMNIHGVFNIAHAQLVEEYEKEVEVDVAEEATPQNEKMPVSPKADDATNGDTENKQQPENDIEMPNTEPAKVTKKVMKKKKFTKYHDLNIDVENMQFDNKRLNEYSELEINLIQQDKLERERVNAKNAVEEYVYEMRSKLQNSLGSFGLPQDIELLLSLLDETENWLYEDGENVLRQIYVDRLNSLKVKGDPIEIRAFEHRERGQVVIQFRESIVHVRKVLDMYAANNATYDHLSTDQIKQLENSVIEHENWLNQKLYDQGLLPQTADPVVKVADIFNQKRNFELVCGPIINTPKPAPAPSPPSASSKSEQSTNANNTNSESAGDANRKDDHHSNTSGKHDEHMDLD